MSVISSSLRNLSVFLQDHQVSFSNGLLILFTIGGEQIFRFNAFKCPCTQPEAYYYALIFMLAPALILGVIGVAVSNLTWRILHGCSHRTKDSANGFCKTSQHLIIAIARAAVVPCAWLFIALLDGNYYACMQAIEPCGINSDRRESEEITYLKAKSQNIAWISLGGLILLSLTVICISRCCDSVTYVQYKYLNFYREAEQQQIDKLIQECTTKMAESNVKILIAKQQLDKNDWDSISKIPDHTISSEVGEDQGSSSRPSSLAVDSGNVPQIFLTPLHEWANQHKTDELQEQQGV